MLTRPPRYDRHCLLLILYVVLDRILDSAVQEFASRWEDRRAFAAHLRTLPQLNDGYGVLPGAPRIACSPRQRLRAFSKNPNCTERSADFLTVAECLDPDTPRTLVTIWVGDEMHILPIEYTKNGVEPVILNPEVDEATALTPNLGFAAVAQMFGYGDGQPSPTNEPLAWAEQLAAREGIQPRNSADLLAVVERYADVYPNGRNGLAALTEKLGEGAATVAQGIKDATRAAAKGGKVVVKEGRAVAEVTAEELRKRPEIGRLLRGAIVGYGGPFAVLAIDVVEKRLRKRGYTLGPVAESRDADVFAFK